MSNLCIPRKEAVVIGKKWEAIGDFRSVVNHVRVVNMNNILMIFGEK